MKKNVNQSVFFLFAISSLTFSITICVPTTITLTNNSSASQIILYLSPVNQHQDIPLLKSDGTLFVAETGKNVISLPETVAISAQTSKGQVPIITYTYSTAQQLRVMSLSDNATRSNVIPLTPGGAYTVLGAPEALALIQELTQSSPPPQTPVTQIPATQTVAPQSINVTSVQKAPLSVHTITTKGAPASATPSPVVHHVHHRVHTEKKLLEKKVEKKN